MTTYMCKFDKEGRRDATYVNDNLMTAERLKGLIAEGFIEYDEETFKLMIGHIDGQEYIRNPETGELEPLPDEYSPNEVEEL